MNPRNARLRLKQYLITILTSCVMACNRGSSTPTQAVYASLPDQHMLAIFAATAAATHLATIKEPATDIPIDVGIDGLTEVFVANQNGNVKVYAGRNYDYQMVRGLAGPHTQMQHLNAFAVDQAGGLYVADSGGSGSGDAKILVFAANMNGDIPPDHWIGGPHTGLTTPTGISIDATGRAFLADPDEVFLRALEPGRHHVAVLVPAGPEGLPVPGIPGIGPGLNDVSDGQAINKRSIHGGHVSA